MLPSNIPQSIKYQSLQRGATLVITLLILVVLTILGVSLFGTTVPEEKMARNYRDLSVAFNASEAALRDAEIRITGYYVYASNANGTPTPLNPLKASSTCTDGFCDPTAAQPVDQNFSMVSAPSVALGTCPTTNGCDGNGNGTTTASPTIGGVSQQPRYLIELIPWAPPGSSLTSASSNYAYRITAAGIGRSATTQSYLQEVFLPY